MTPTCLSHFADLPVPLTVRTFDGGYAALPICFSVFRHWSASLALPDNPSLMSSADSRPLGRASRGHPGCFRMRNRRIYMRAPLTATGTIYCVAPLSLCLMPHIRLRRRFRHTDSCTSAHILASNFLKGLLRVDPLSPASLSHCQAWDWTCSLIVPTLHLMLDACLNVGTLAKRSSKQPGIARHTTRFRSVRRNSADAQNRRWS